MNLLAERIRQRLDFLRISPRRASIEAGLSPAAVAKMLSGASESPRFSSLEALAGVLQCSAAYLAGVTDVIGDDEAPMPHTLSLLCEARLKAWLEPQELGRSRGVVFASPIGAEADAQFGVLVLDDHADEIIPAGSVVHAVSDFEKVLREGDLVVALRGRGGGVLIEVAVWRVHKSGEETILHTASSKPRLQVEVRFTRADDHPGGTDSDGETVTILGRAVRAYVPLGGVPLYEMLHESAESGASEG